MIKTTGQKDVLGIHIRPTGPVLKEFDWDGVQEIAKTLIPMLGKYADVDEIKKDPNKVVAQGFAAGKYKMIALPFENVCGRTIILMFDWEQSRKTVQDGWQRSIDRG